MIWSTLLYVFGQEKEDEYAEEETDAGGVITSRWQSFSGKTGVLAGDDRIYADIRVARLGAAKEAA